MTTVEQIGSGDGLQPAGQVRDSRPKRSIAQVLGLDRFSALYLWAGFMIYFGFTQDAFLTGTSFKLVLTEKTIIAILAIGFLIPLTSNTLDLSVGQMMGFSACIIMTLTKDYPNLSPVIAMAIAMVCCGIAGFVSGFIVVKLNVNSFIATLGMSQVLYALCVNISGNRTITETLSDGYRNIGRRKLMFGLPTYFYMMIALAIVVWYVLEHTPFGRYLFATGGNREAARLSGVNVNRLSWATLVISALIGGFAGVVHSWKVAVYSSTTGPSLLFPAVAAVFFGASQLKGRANLWGTLIAVFALAFGVKGLQLTFTRGTAWIEPLFEGTSLLIAVAIASRKGIVKVRRRAS